MHSNYPLQTNELPITIATSYSSISHLVMLNFLPIRFTYNLPRSHCTRLPITVLVHCYRLTTNTLPPCGTSVPGKPGSSTPWDTILFNLPNPIFHTHTNSSLSLQFQVYNQLITSCNPTLECNWLLFSLIPIHSSILTHSFHAHISNLIFPTS